MAIPSYFSRNTKPENNLKKFFRYVEDMTLLSQTEDTKIGWEYIKEAEKKVALNEIIDNIDEYGSDKAIALVTIAQEENVKDNELKEALLSSMSIECVSGYGSENFMFYTPVNRIIDIDLHGFKGKLDTVEYADIYSKLIENFTPEELEYVSDQNVSDIENDTMHVKIPRYYWAAFLDEEKFKDVLTQKLEMTSDEIEQLAKVS